jgi:hypothetical protein
VNINVTVPTIEQAKAYVAALDLSGIPTPYGERGVAAATFVQAKDQARIVGSGLMTFREGVEVDIREAVSESILLAQLVANKRVDAAVDPMRWFIEYAGVLQNVGWTVQGSSWNDYSSTGTAAEVSEKIIELLPILLGPGTAALTVATTAVNALRAMDPDSSWIKIFSRETQKARIGRFEVGVAERAQDGVVQISSLACLLEAQTTIAQVLFFKLRSENASFRANTNQVTISAATLRDLAEPISSKVRAHRLNFLTSIEDI